MEYFVTAIIVGFVYYKLSKMEDSEIFMSSKRRYEIQNEVMGELKWKSFSYF